MSSIVNWQIFNGGTILYIALTLNFVRLSFCRLVRRTGKPVLLIPSTVARCRSLQRRRRSWNQWTLAGQTITHYQRTIFTPRYVISWVCGDCSNAQSLNTSV